MSRDIYSDNHVINVLSGSDLYLRTDDGDVFLQASGPDGDIKLLANKKVDVNGGESCIFFAKDYIQLRSQGGDGTIEITGDKSLELNGTIISMVSSEFSLKAQDGPIDISNGNTGEDVQIKAGNDLKLSAGNFVEIKAHTNLDLGSNGTVRLASDQEMQIVGTSALHLDSKGFIDIQSKGDILIEAGLGMLPSTGDVILAPYPSGVCSIEGNAEVSEDIKVEGAVLSNNIRAKNFPGVGSSIKVEAKPASSSNRFVMEVHNCMEDPAGNGGNGILIDISSPTFFSQGGIPNSNTNWMRFSWDESWKGAIQGSEPIALGQGYFGIGSSFNGNVIAPATTIMGPLFTTMGNAQFVSGAADFGEFFEVGDPGEWAAITRSARPESRTFGLPEGIVVWAIGEKFFKAPKEGVGIPMFITKRAIMVGSGRPDEKSSADSAEGEVLSFIGKLPVLVEGAVGIGDLLLPIEEKGICRGVPKGEASLQDYMKALGTALTDCPSETLLPDDHPNLPGKVARLHLLTCAVGVK